MSLDLGNVDKEIVRRRQRLATSIQYPATSSFCPVIVGRIRLECLSHFVAASSSSSISDELDHVHRLQCAVSKFLRVKRNLIFIYYLVVS